MRIGEICGLKWSDIDASSGIIKVRRTVQRIYVIEKGQRHTEILIDTPKTKNSIRDIPMNNELIKIMKPLLKVVNHDHFIINESKHIKPRTKQSYYEHLIKYRYFF